MAISLPRVVGEAVWPWVRESIGWAACSSARRATSSATRCIIGSSALRPSVSITPWERLLMSSLVQAKCTNSVTACSSGWSAIFSLMKYSTALTSWLVVRSMALMRSASATEKSRISPSRKAVASAESGGTSVTPGSSARRSSQRISTMTRARIRPNSLKCSRRRSALAP